MKNLDEITNLINIRAYVSNSINNPVIDKSTVNYLNGALILIDKKIITLLQSSEFKEYINYSDVIKAIQEARNITNIKSSIKK